MMESKRLRIRHSAQGPVKSPTYTSHHEPETSNQGFAALIVMIAVLTIIILFCCFAAPGIRDLCKRYVLRSCVVDDPDTNNVTTTTESATPTIILLPYGRMLVVDRTMFSQLQADHTGIDFMELSANIIRHQRYPTGSTPSFLDSETTSKGVSPSSLGLSPPAYEDIFFDKNQDLPPSYSELSLMFRTQTRRQENSEYTNNNDNNNRNIQNIEMSGIVIDIGNSDNSGNARNMIDVENIGSDVCGDEKSVSDDLDQVDADNAESEVNIDIPDDVPSTSYTWQDSLDGEVGTCFLRESSL